MIIGLRNNTGLRDLNLVDLLINSQNALMGEEIPIYDRYFRILGFADHCNRYDLTNKNTQFLIERPRLLLTNVETFIKSKDMYIVTIEDNDGMALIYMERI